jgi:hypothetical protein
MINKKFSAIVVAIIASSAILTGCNRSLNSIAPAAPPRALPSTPAENVDSSQLPPLVSNDQVTINNTGENLQQPPIDNTAANQSSVSPSQQLASGEQKITREALAGSWQVPTDGLDCRIILAFTKWSGGYRAATRRCISAEIQSINAWDIKDQSVVLVDKSGNEVARLFATQSGQYNGRTASGEPVSFVR